jgi:hypothetical protein
MTSAVSSAAIDDNEKRFGVITNSVPTHARTSSTALTATTRRNRGV